MNMQNQVTSLEISKQLEKAGVPQEGLFYWVNYIDSSYVDPSGERIYTALSVVCDKKALNRLIKRKYARIEDVYRAFLASELLEMLPDNIYLHRTGNVYIARPHIDVAGEPVHLTQSDSPQDALAQMVLYLVEKKIINFKNKYEDKN